MVDCDGNKYSEDAQLLEKGKLPRVVEAESILPVPGISVDLLRGSTFVHPLHTSLPAKIS